jgi:MFS family permease
VSAHAPVLGLRANWRQFSLLVVVNAFVGAMVGIERTALPLLAEVEFGLASHVAILSFIATFGAVKAAANLVAGHWSDRIGRKPLLVAGWLAGLPVPLLLIYAPTWEWVLVANLFLGVNQGLTWSTTVIMKIDLVGPARRGLAMGLNEAAGYGALALAALASGYLAASLAIRPYPFLLGMACALAGLVLSVFAVKETRTMLPPTARRSPPFLTTLLFTSWRQPTLTAVCLTGLVNNLNDGVVWGLLPLFLADRGLDLVEIGALAALYPAVWCIGQLATGAFSDHCGRKPLIVAGMVAQAAGIAGLLAGQGTAWWAVCMAALGVGTAMVYPTLLAAISDLARPEWRGGAVGVYRLWRDLGYAAGALGAGLLADSMGMPWAIAATATVTLAAALFDAIRMDETVPRPRAL